MDYELFFKKIAPNKYELTTNRMSRKRYLISYEQKKEVIALYHTLMGYACKGCASMVPLSLYSLRSAIFAFLFLLISIIIFYVRKFNSMRQSFDIIYLEKKEPPLLICKKMADRQDWSEILKEVIATFLVLILLLMLIYKYIETPTKLCLSFSIFFSIFYTVGTFVIGVKVYYKMLNSKG